MILLRDLPSDADLAALSKRYPDLDPAGAAAFLAFLRAACEVFHASEGHFARYGTSCGRFTVLSLLNREPGRSLTPSQIAVACGVTRATMTGLLDGLEHDRLIGRTRGTDRRTQHIRLTAGGRRFLDSMLPDHFRRMSRLMQGINAGERRSLRTIADKLTANVTSLAGTPSRSPR